MKNRLFRAVLEVLLLSALAVSMPLGAQSSGSAAEPDFGGTRVAAASADDDGSFRTLDEDVQDLKKLAADLNRDLFLLEEELLFPANTQVAIFVSMDVGEFFALDSVEILLDDKNVANYLYTEREVDALIRGGVQRVYVGNIKAGEHELAAFFTGEGPHTRDYRRGASLSFEKGIGPKYIELTISDREDELQPAFVVREWE